MNRRTCIKTGAMAVVAASLSLPHASAKSGMLGKLGPDEFKKANESGGAQVKAVKPDGAALSKDDAALLTEVAMGGMMQLETSKVAVKMASSEDVRMIAKAEVEEQTILSAKVAEIAKSGGVALPASPDEKTTKMIEKLKGQSGTELDKQYLKDTGVKGHEMLRETMEKVQSKAENPALKSLAAAALPLIKTHLEVAKDETSDIG